MTKEERIKAEEARQAEKLRKKQAKEAVRARREAAKKVWNSISIGDTIEAEVLKSSNLYEMKVSVVDKDKVAFTTGTSYYLNLSDGNDTFWCSIQVNYENHEKWILQHTPYKK